MDLQDMFQDPIFRRNSIASIVFAILFPAYFMFAAAGTVTLMPTGGSNVSGNWNVTFNETDVATSESTEFLMDEEEFIFEFTFTDEDPNLAYVEITVSHDETDESGANPVVQNQCDNAIGQMRMGQVNDFVRPDSTMEGESPNNCPASYTMTIMLIENYTGESYQTSGKNGEIENLWVDNGSGRGEYRCQITLETRTGSAPGPGGGPILNNNEDGEEITVSWRVVAVDVSVTLDESSE